MFCGVLSESKRKQYFTEALLTECWWSLDINLFLVTLCFYAEDWGLGIEACLSDRYCDDGDDFLLKLVGLFR